MRASAAIIVPATALCVIAACASNPSATQPTAPAPTYGAYPPGYDPQNPGNSLVVSENWMGLRQ